MSFPEPGAKLIAVSVASTAVFTVACVAGMVAVDAVAPLVVWLSALMFLAGCVLFFVAYAIAVSRSRTEQIGVGGLYFLAGSAPSNVRRPLVGALVVQCIVVVVIIVVRPFTSLVLAALAPMFALGCAGVWAAKHGTFPPRLPTP